MAVWLEGRSERFALRLHCIVSPFLGVLYYYVCFLEMTFGTLSLYAPYRRVSGSELCEGVERRREHVQ